MHAKIVKNRHRSEKFGPGYKEATMNIQIMRRFLLWCTIINYGILLVWFLIFLAAHDWMQYLHGVWFHLTLDQFDALHYAGMTIYKIGILLFNLVPLIALSVVRKESSSAKHE